MATSRAYAELTGGGDYNLPVAVEKRINLENGSTFYPALIDIPYFKQNGGMLHMPGGIINHFIANQVRRRFFSVSNSLSFEIEVSKLVCWRSGNLSSPWKQVASGWSMQIKYRM